MYKSHVFKCTLSSRLFGTDSTCVLGPLALGPLPLGFCCVLKLHLRITAALLAGVQLGWPHTAVCPFLDAHTPDSKVAE